MEKEIIEGNKLIAEFMGYMINVPNCYCFSGGPITGETIRLGNVFAKTDITKNNLPAFYESYGKTNTRLDNDEYIVNPEYYTSWDWLMPVVEKIESLDKFSFAINYHPKHNTWVGIHNATEYGITNLVIPEVLEIKKIDAVYKAVVQFIKWYNQQL